MKHLQVKHGHAQCAQRQLQGCMQQDPRLQAARCVLQGCRLPVAGCKGPSARTACAWGSCKQDPRLRAAGCMLQGCRMQLSAELSRTLKVLDRGRNTQKPDRNRSESGCVGLWAPPRAFWASFRPVWGRFGLQIGDFQPDSQKFSGPF